jgi:hypothetical protein
MTQLASKMESLGYILRSGGAAGADSAFEAGVKNPSAMEIYLPGRNFNARVAGGSYIDASSLPSWKQALETVQRYHPAPERLSPYVRNLMARNAMQVLGSNLAVPSKMIVAWTPGGLLQGGTAQALRMAHDKGIAIRNLGNPQVLQSVKQFLAK